jgi:predicted hydrocarbon binding protein
LNRSKRRFFGYHFDPPKKTFQIVARIKDTPGALGVVLEALRTHINLIGSVSYVTDQGNAVWSGFAEALSPSETEAELKKIMSHLDVVEESIVKTSEDGLLVDDYHLGIEVGLGEDFIMLPAKGVSHTYDHLTELFGSGGDTILYDEGFSLGKVNARYFMRLLGADLARQKVHQLAALYGTMGWGNAQMEIENTAASFTVVVENCFECSAKRRVRTTCSFMRGHLAGFLSTTFETILRSSEEKCRFRGDPVCEFRLVQAGEPLPS